MSDYPSPGTPGTSNEIHQNLMAYLHHLSGQEREVNVFEIDHGYAKPWNRHPDPAIKSRPAKFLFMKSFPRHFARSRDNSNTFIDVDTIDDGNGVDRINPFIAEVQALTPRTPTTPFLGPGLVDEASLLVDRAPVDKRAWSSAMHKLWNRSLKILQTDRLGRLVCEGKANEIIVKRNLLEKAASRLRQSFASIVAWDASQLAWLHAALQAYITPIFLVSYHEAMQLLRQKVPTLVDKFYMPPKTDGANARSKQIQSDPIQTVLNNYRPVRKLFES